MNILITGSNGQLGTELRHLFDSRQIVYTGANSNELDITDKEQVDNYFRKHQPKVIYHCAAYTAVDKAEMEPGKSANNLVNIEGTKNIAIAAEAIGSKLVYISTDYVFDGTKLGEYGVEDEPNPINEYGKAKLLGENMVKKYCQKHYIVRTSWVFGKYGKNFVYTMLELAKTNKSISVVNDQIGRPTWTRSLAEFITYLVDNSEKFGTYQFSNEGSCSWYEFALIILKDSDVVIQPVSSDKFPQEAVRPKHSVMDLTTAQNVYSGNISWKEALEDFVISLK